MGQAQSGRALGLTGEPGVGKARNGRSVPFGDFENCRGMPHHRRGAAVARTMLRVWVEVSS